MFRRFWKKYPAWFPNHRIFGVSGSKEWARELTASQNWAGTLRTESEIQEGKRTRAIDLAVEANVKHHKSINQECTCGSYTDESQLSQPDVEPCSLTTRFWTSRVPTRNRIGVVSIETFDAALNPTVGSDGEPAIRILCDRCGINLLQFTMIT